MPALSCSVATVRKAASLAVGVPGISLIVYQADWPPLSVSSNRMVAPHGEVWLAMGPDRFRRELCRPCGQYSRLVGPTLGTGETTARIEYAFDDSSSIDNVGIFTVRHESGEGEIGFVTLSDIDRPSTCNPSDGCPVDLPAPTQVTRDAALGTERISWHYDATDEQLARAVQTAALDLRLSTAVDEIVLLSGNAA